ncbi:hypothetical protein [Bifidobacterium bombi]|uniref:Uncharacterized protein n=1 Tax=Bifidobacterium bombi DSM 19703 TaxID=1341695 RepID=A0A080N3S5_9BIFI|nr:hypothetical protein [Bifidobacterium bombi]KFF30780.1 hypothetical protein BBOMB_0091 [Bifidobacterium bombi DSM 19703]
MIFIKVVPQKKSDFIIDGQQIDWVGVPFSYNSAIPEDRAEFVQHNRGIWRIGERAKDERYIAFTFESKVICVAEISDIRPSEQYPERSYFVCTPLGPGSPVYDKWIGKDQPFAVRSRNPISYWHDYEIDGTSGWSWRNDDEILDLIDGIAKRENTRENLIAFLKRTDNQQ